MSDKRLPSGVRGPLPNLWEMVHRVPEDQWRRLKAFSEVYGKGSLQFRLVELLRSMKAYDPALEKAAFSENDLDSLRRSARRWLVRTGQRLGFASNEVEEQQDDVQMLMVWGHYREAHKYIKEAKRLAVSQEDFLAIASLLERERAVARELFKGDELTGELQRISTEARQNLKHIGMATEMAEFTATMLEPVKNKLISTGELDRVAVEGYFHSQAFGIEVDSLPVTVQVEKLTLDEFFFNQAGDFASAELRATRIADLLIGHPAILKRFPDQLSKVLRRLAAFRAKLGHVEKAIEVVEMFEAQEPFAEDRREHYLLRYLFVLFQLAIDCRLPELASKAVRGWEGQRDYVLSLPGDELRSVTLLCMAWFHVGRGEIGEARRLFQALQTPQVVLSRILYQAMLAILHLVLMFEEADSRGLESIGLNLRRKLRPSLPDDSPVLLIFTVLRGQTNLINPEIRKKSLRQLASDLRRCQLQPDWERSLWYDPILDWIERQTESQ